MYRHEIQTNKKLYLRKCSIEGARNYNHYLVGKVFLIICEDGTESLIRFFKTDFVHLTGIESNLRDNAFYKQCIVGKLTDGNINNYQKYNWQTLKGKADRVKKIHKIVYADVKNSLFMFQLHTRTGVFPVAIRNSVTNTCVGYKGDIHKARSLRKFTNSGNADAEKKIAAIFAKQEDQEKYNELVYISTVQKLYKNDKDFVNKLSDTLKDRLLKFYENCDNETKEE